jgi:hypothetical protein
MEENPHKVTKLNAKNLFTITPTKANKPQVVIEQVTAKP